MLGNPLGLVDPLGLTDCDWLCRLKGFFFGGSEGEGGGGSSIWVDPSLPTFAFSVTATGTTGGTGKQQPQPKDVAKALKQVCANLPSGGVQGVGAAIGGLVGVTGSAEIVTNYRTGQVSAFIAGGAAVFPSVASGSAYKGFVSGLKGDNSNYSGGFTTASVSVGTPLAHLGVQGAYSRSSAGLSSPLTAQGVWGDGQVSSLTLGANASLLSPSVFPALALTNYSAPKQIGKYWTLGDPSGLILFLSNQVCAASGN